MYPWFLFSIILLIVFVRSTSEIFVHGFLVPFVVILWNFLKYLWWPRRGARYFTVQNSDLHADAVPFSKSKAEVRLKMFYSGIFHFGRLPLIFTKIWSCSSLVTLILLILLYELSWQIMSYCLCGKIGCGCKGGGGGIYWYVVWNLKSAAV